MTRLLVPSGATSIMSRSSGNVLEIFLSVTDIVVIVPGIPVTFTVEGYKFAVPLAVPSAIVIGVGSLKITAKAGDAIDKTRIMASICRLIRRRFEFLFM